MARKADPLVAEALPDPGLYLDWMMPLLSGKEVCRQLKTREEIRAISPVIMLSHDPEEVTNPGCAAGDGADDYVVKPLFDARADAGVPHAACGRVRCVLRAALSYPTLRLDTRTSPCKP